jgi:hypothetical protein
VPNEPTIYRARDEHGRLYLVFVRKKRPVIRALVVVAGCALLASLYPGLVMRMAGASEGAFGSPREIVEEAKTARDAANAQRQAKEQAADALRE